MPKPIWKERMDALQITDLNDIFRTAKPIIGMVHCWPLPGAPGYTGYGIQTIVDNALRDTYALAEGGVDGIIVENMWDIPYRVGPHIAPESIAAHAVVAHAVREAIDIPMGINVVHNGSTALLGIALASRADFIRVCMFTGAGVWDAGSWDEGCAADLLRRRKELGAEHIKILADVDKKHSVRFPGIDLATHMQWTCFFGADALIVSGTMTGDAPDLDKVRQAKRLAGNQPVLIGSGTTIDNIVAFMGVADGVIVGSSIKEDGLCEHPVSRERVRILIHAARVHAE
ncbi:MAG: BtpA/SgcQ family protein [Chloroflexi bacterium AL-W]|nr:BtpA/SgcQ family protein [Chloroflexi bacterium AL-N1]NOK68174.1 BtpA/SgcQ family protein [Chloroflexi bacterium AL-N10]NOK73514.1 BtpA/SgcQ family protein [Chloroflexi bacterium AL-N5]NOK84052.1 BtpA/SgcQ family protein [Chloroflexi bacterium AL-W]NOK87845.1 BtpA/SgcQ family protein [Chloroflexi bacterium AL-N15]